MKHVFLIIKYWDSDIWLFVLRLSTSVQVSRKLFGIINEREFQIHIGRGERVDSKINKRGSGRLFGTQDYRLKMCQNFYDTFTAKLTLCIFLWKWCFFIEVSVSAFPPEDAEIVMFSFFTFSWFIFHFSDVFFIWEIICEMYKISVWYVRTCPRTISQQTLPQEQLPDCSLPDIIQTDIIPRADISWERTSPRDIYPNILPLSFCFKYSMVYTLVLL